MRTLRVFPMLIGAAMLVAVSACSSGATAGWTFPPHRRRGQPECRQRDGGHPGHGRHAAAWMPPLLLNRPRARRDRCAPARLSLTIVTGDMIGHTEFPAFIPSDFTLPANSTVIVTITNFDDATALPKGQESYASVQGTTDGTFRVQPINPKDPNGNKGQARTATSLNPTTGVSHTFTIKALGVNVPIAPMSRTTFVIKTGAPGTYVWHCYDPCGDGPDGWGTAMAAMQGFMEGTVTVA